VNTEKIRVMQECARGSLAGELTFPEVVGRLAAVGAERYHADYSRQEIEDVMGIATSSIFRRCRWSKRSEVRRAKCPWDS
jgi:hypothetical protein